jgi:hypothetical protein
MLNIKGFIQYKDMVKEYRNRQGITPKDSLHGLQKKKTWTGLNILRILKK